MLPYSQDEAIKQNLLGDGEHSIFSELLDDVGDGSGTKNMAGAADVYLTTTPAGSIYVIDAVEIVIVDASAIDIDGWGGLVALITGCKFEIQRDEGTSGPITVHDFTGGVTLKNHGQLARLGEINFTSDATGCIVQSHVHNKTPFRLDGNKGESLVFEIQDNLAGLVTMEVAIHGRKFFAKS